MNLLKIQVLVLCTSLAGGELWASDAKAKIQEGIELHDAGDFKAAIEVFESVLETEPKNTGALYELTNSYFASGDFESCIATSKVGLKHPSALDVGFHSLAGSCYSSSGKPQKALKSFRSGLDIAPNHASLNFNIAVTLANSGDRGAAIEHLERAINSRPSYASPYYLLAELYRQSGARVPSLFYFARFFTLEPNSHRSSSAATTIFSLLSSGIKVKPGGDVDVTVPSLKEKDPMSGLELSLSLAGAAMFADEGEEARSQAERQVSALTTFLQIVLEMSESDDQELQRTAVWKQAMAPIQRIHQRGGSEALGFVIARKAGIEGAAEWAVANLEKIEALSGLLGE